MRINTAYKIFIKSFNDVKLLPGYKGNAFAFSGNFTDDLLSFKAVQSMRENVV